MSSLKKSIVSALGIAAVVFCFSIHGARADGMEEAPAGAKPKSVQTIGDGTKTPPIRQSGHAGHAKSGDTGNTKALGDFELAKYQYCGRDSDCVVAINGCCDCVNGGTEVAVNAERLAAFEARFDCLHVQCSHNPANPPCENGVVSCVNHRCRYFDNRPSAEPEPTPTPETVKPRRRAKVAEGDAHQPYEAEPAPANQDPSNGEVIDDEMGAPEPYYE
ncbi:MAG: hypothetical protein KDD69_02410 [Bdellovibrionales bacterium]|nr:hypothetical protein [Bdellovibrionales bacterium]